MLAALNIGAVMIGLAAGGLAASVLGLAIGGLLTVGGFDSGGEIGLVVGILVGFLTGGWVTGLRARHSSRFHGAVTGLVMAFLVMLIAVLGGSPASTLSIIWLALLSTVLSGTAGWLAGRRRQRMS